jgi:putative DNA primase/helicase
VKDWNDAHKAGVDIRATADQAWAKTEEPTTNGGARASEEPERFDLECLANVEPVPIRWLWPDHLAIGKLTLLGGDPDLGKTLICNDTAARLSTQRHWPNGPKPLKAGSTIFLCSEDATADTVRPRCEAAGADLTLLHVLKMRAENGRRKAFSLQDDLGTLGQAIDSVSASLVCIDAITSYMGKCDSHRTTDVRAVLEPVADFAEDHNVAIIGVTHPPKAAQGSAIRALTGSYAFVAAPRLAFFVTSEPESDRRLLLPVKNNIGPKSRGLGYRISTQTVTNGIIAPCLIWSDEPVGVTADQAIAAAHAALKDGGALKDAKEFLQQQLASGPVDAKEALEAADAHGIAERTLKRARKELGVKADKCGLDGGWMWKL